MNLLRFSISALTAAILSSITTTSVADRFTIQVDNQNKGIVKALTKKLGGNVHIDGNGFIAASFTGQDLEQLKGLLKHPKIKLIEIDQKRYLLSVFSDDIGDPMAHQLTPYAVYQSQANQVTFNPNAGMKVCIIDSGLDWSNSDFIWGNIDGDNDSGTGNWDENGGPHGTHVAGTIAAADNNIGVVGMAPGVDLHIIKVFNATGWGYSSDLAHATEKCSTAGANIISMSLGGGGANSTEDNAFKAFNDGGGLVLAAAGNDGNSARSYPAGYSSVMMIAANDAENKIADFSQYPSCNVTTGRGRNRTTTADETICVEVSAGGVNTLSTYPANMATAASLAVDNVYFASSAMENSGSVSGNTYNMGTAEVQDVGANGNICVIERGNISFHDKVKNCENSGGVGAVIINNVDGMLYGTLGGSNTTTIPAVGAAFEDSASLLSASNMSIVVGSSDYGYMSGTSMATPAVSGVAALVWSNHNGCTGAQIRAALKASAQDYGDTGHDVKFGYGIVKAKAANDYLIANGCSAEVVEPEEPIGDFILVADGYKRRGSKKVDLSWSGSSTNVDIFRDGNKIADDISGSTYTDSINSKGGGNYTYQVCEIDSTTCSDSVVVVF